MRVQYSVYCRSVEEPWNKRCGSARVSGWQRTPTLSKRCAGASRPSSNLTPTTNPHPWLCCYWTRNGRPADVSRTSDCHLAILLIQYA